MSIFTNPGKVFGNIWDDIADFFKSSIYPYLKKVEQDAQEKGEEILLEVGKAVLGQAKDQLGHGARAGDILKAAVELGIPMLESRGIAAATLLLYNVISALLISLESHGK